MKRYFYLLLLPALMLMASCHEKEEKDKPARHYDRTVMVYMAMQNSLGAENYHRQDSTEIANAMGYLRDNDCMLLFIDDVRAPRIYELTRELTERNPKTGLPYGPKLLKQWTEDRSSASAAMLTEVLEFMKTKYPSDSYGLVMESHATGWLPQSEVTGRAPRKTFGIDVGPDGSMRNDTGVAGSRPDEIEITDLGKAITASGVKLTYLLFDACLMQCIESDYELRNAADYIIASPISISGEGAYYTDLVREGLFSSSPEDVARVYASYYKGEGSIPYKDDYGTVISCVRTAGLEDLADAVRNTWASIDVLQNTKDATERIEQLKTVDLSTTDALKYHNYSSHNLYRPHYYDLLSAFVALGAKDDALAQLRRTLSNVVMYKGSSKSFWIGPGMWTFQSLPEDDDAWCGVSMFVPQQIYSNNAETCRLGDLNARFLTTSWCKRVF